MGSVVVHDIDLLEVFMEMLQGKRDDLESLYGELGTETTNQESNWKDPQYDYLKEKVDSYCSACRVQLNQLDESISYISGLIAKLRNL